MTQICVTLQVRVSHANVLVGSAQPVVVPLDPPELDPPELEPPELLEVEPELLDVDVPPELVELPPMQAS